jgi:hypothetical protein
MFPAQAPRDRDVNLHFLAAQFPIAGGEIQNVALDVAFLAAQDGQVIRMKHLNQSDGPADDQAGQDPIRG